MTPEQRREALLQVAAYDDITEARTFYERLLDHFDEHEPAVADAIRYGGTIGYRGTWFVDTDDPSTGVNNGVSEFEGMQEPLFINYPKGHPKNP